jgi:hypothetical protein
VIAGAGAAAVAVVAMDMFIGIAILNLGRDTLIKRCWRLRIRRIMPRIFLIVLLLLLIFIIFITKMHKINYSKNINRTKVTVIIPVRIVDGQLTVPVQIGAQRGWMVFDTGAPFTLVFGDRLSTSTALTITNEAKTVSFPFWETSVVARIGLIKFLYVGKLSINNRKLSIIDIGSINKKNVPKWISDNKDIFGILGMDLFENYTLIISKNYLKIINLLDNYHKQVSELKFYINNHSHIKIKIKIGSSCKNMLESNAVLDTGMGYNVPPIILSPKFAKRLHNPKSLCVELANHHIRLRQYGMQAKEYYPSDVMIGSRILNHYKIIINYSERWIAFDRLPQPQGSLEVPLGRQER